MDLKVKDIVELLGVNEKTVYRWLKEKKIPAYRINHQYRFSKTEINEWLLKNKIGFTDKIFSLSVSKSLLSLKDLISRGSIIKDLQGSDVSSIIRNAVMSITIPPDMDREKIIMALLKREEMMSTGIGGGIAIPHPRTPLITAAESAQVSICMLEKPADFKSLDGERVHTLFIVLSANPKRHLEVLSQISFLCQKPDFRKLLEEKAKGEMILSYIEETEKKYLYKTGKE